MGLHGASTIPGSDWCRNLRTRKTRLHRSNLRNRIVVPTCGFAVRDASPGGDSIVTLPTGCGVFMMRKRIALFGAGGKMGYRLASNLKGSAFEVRHVEVAPAGQARLKSGLGLDCVSP